MTSWSHPAGLTPRATTASVNRLRLLSFEHFLKARVASELIPLPAQTEFSLGDASVIKILSCGRSRGPQKAFDQREGLI